MLTAVRGSIPNPSNISRCFLPYLETTNESFTFDIVMQFSLRRILMVLGIAAVITAAIDCVFRAKEPGLTFLNAARKACNASVRYRRTSGHKYVDSSKGSESELRHFCEPLNLDPDLWIVLK